MDENWINVDGNEAAASVAYRLNEVIAIYPITPASPMGELADAWAVAGITNLWGLVPSIVEMQAEGGAAGTVHGSLQAGALTTTFTASQGLLLMIPNMYKIAGELSPCCIHVAARTIATHALSIFGDHSDVMAARASGFAMLCSGSVQEAQDFAALGTLASLGSRVPFLHFFDGFRTSHEIARIAELADEDLRSMVDETQIAAHRDRALRPDAPVLRGTAQNPDTFFQAREACNSFYDQTPGILAELMERFAELTGRYYGLVDYFGHPEAERVVVMMGSGAECAEETVSHMAAEGERVGLIKIRLFRPFPIEAFAAALPASVTSIAVLDRTKEPGAVAEPLYLEIMAALGAAGRSVETLIGGRYGLSSKEFTPRCVKAVLDELVAEAPKRLFTIGIVDDISGLSLTVDQDYTLPSQGVHEAVFFGLGSDGTVSANKSSIKIIGEATELWPQGYFVYDSKKSGAVTVSHLRFAADPVRSTYLIEEAGFVACHDFSFLDRYDVIERAAPGGTLLLNTPFDPKETWGRLSMEVQQQILDKGLELWAIDAVAIAREAGLGRRINTIMQTCFFEIAKVLPMETALQKIKAAIAKTYGRRGRAVVERNYEVVDSALAGLVRLELPSTVSSERVKPPIISPEAPEFVQRVTAVMLSGKGDALPVSAFPVDGTWPTGTAKWEKRSIAHEIPIWESDICIQCNQCVLACPHAAIRAKLCQPSDLEKAPESFKSVPFKSKDAGETRYVLQVAPEDCTGCHLCVEVCPAKNKANPREKAIVMRPKDDHIEAEVEAFDHFLGIPESKRSDFDRLDIKTSQFLQPLFEFSGACAGCGETPYVKLLSQLFGDRLLVANATGCSSIFGGNLPTTPWAVDASGRGPAWSNSLFEDNAEFGLGMRLAVDAKADIARSLLHCLKNVLPDNLVSGLLEADQSTDAGIDTQRERLVALRSALAESQLAEARRLESVADALVETSVWLVGGDGWAYDIGYGGLDHVLASGRKVNILVLDTEVYSNTGGQASKATPMGAAAKFAVAGKEVPKKDLGLEAMSYGSVYVARIAFGAKMAQTVNAFKEADSYPGTSLIIAYSHCIAHGFDLAKGAEQQKGAVDCGVWPLYRFDPRRIAAGQPPLKLDSGKPKMRVADYALRETRYRMVERVDPERSKMLLKSAQRHAERQRSVYEQLAGLMISNTAAEPAE